MLRVPRTLCKHFEVLGAFLDIPFKSKKHSDDNSARAGAIDYVEIALNQVWQMKPILERLEEFKGAPTARAPTIGAGDPDARCRRLGSNFYSSHEEHFCARNTQGLFFAVLPKI